MPRRFALCLALFATLGSATPLWAADEPQPQEPAEAPGWYQVEVILFDQASKGYIDSESWPTDISHIDPHDLVELSFPQQSDTTDTDQNTSAQSDGTQTDGAQAQPAGQTLVAPGGSVDEPPTANAGTADNTTAEATQGPPAPPPPKPFVLLPPDEELLNKLYTRLRYSKDYHPLIHVGWRQPGLPKDQSLAVHIFQGMENPPLPEGEVGPPAPLDIDTSALPAGLFTEAGDAMLPQVEQAIFEPAPPLKFDGTVRVVLSRYLHMDVDMRLRKLMTRQPSEDAAKNADATTAIDQLTGSADADTGAAQPVETYYQTFRLQESRRMRSNEVHYFDHPVFGIIATIAPWQPPQPEATGTDDKTQPSDTGAKPAEPAQKP